LVLIFSVHLLAKLALIFYIVNDIVDIARTNVYSTLTDFPATLPRQGDPGQICAVTEGRGMAMLSRWLGGADTPFKRADSTHTPTPGISAA
jgi:hypothetical protein